jgi:dipeptidyl aminopeptidase/acylaminoacyl peptidase
MRTLVALAILASSTVAAADGVTYQRPAKEVANFVDAPPIPVPLLSPDRKTLALVTPSTFPSIAEVAEPELRLAGLRITPRNHATARMAFARGLELLDVQASAGKPRPLTGVPANARIAHLAWSPDGKQLAFTLTEADAIHLWVASVDAATAHAITAPALSGTTGAPCAWLADSRALVCRTVPAGNRPAPAPASVPTGPLVQENTGTKKPAVTNPDLLTGPDDERAFDYYMTSQLALITTGGQVTPIGAPGLYTTSVPSPDGKLLLVEAVHKPFSYRVEIARFPTRSEVWTLAGKALATLADLPLAEDVPTERDAVRTGRRDLLWRDDAPATVCWAEALDGGDPRKPAKLRDQVDCTAAPFGTPSHVIQLADRLRDIRWGTGAIALVTEGRWKDRKTRTWIVEPDAPAHKPRVLWDRSTEDRYTAPGAPVMRHTSSGASVLQVTHAGQLLLTGEGASPQGDRPFLDRLDLATGKAERLWRSDGDHYAAVTAVLDDDATSVLMSRESPTEPPQLYVHALTGTERQLTHNVHPIPELTKVKKQLIKWKRADGVELSGMLYLPPGFRPKQDRPLPVLVWVYPQEFKTADAASQVLGSPYRFVAPQWSGPLFALTQGYAVVDNPKFAIIGEGKTEPNDTYVEQLIADASSMIDAVVALGVGDRERFAVGGHSYGAFTTANLLAHSRLFRAGIARSGAYNRTLTPFGFQSEERSYWDTSAVYDAMSPFRFADKLDAPILLIHGMADNNTGTFPIQSERLFSALQGLGGNVRYVQLPAEAHGYRARESALHVLWEQVRWLDAHVKNAPARRVAQAAR